LPYRCDLHAGGSAKAATWQRQFGVAQKTGEGEREREKNNTTWSSEQQV